MKTTKDSFYKHVNVSVVYYSNMLGAAFATLNRYRVMTLLPCQRTGGNEQSWKPSETAISYSLRRAYYLYLWCTWYLSLRISRGENWPRSDFE